MPENIKSTDRKLREDALAWAFKLNGPATAKEFIEQAREIESYLGERPQEPAAELRLVGEPASSGVLPSGRPEWADVMTATDLAAERDRARETAVRLEQELAEKQRELDEARVHLVKGVLMEVRRIGGNAVTDAGRDAIRYSTYRAAERFGVTL